MSFSTLDENDNDEQGIDPLVLSLEEFSHARDEMETATDGLGSNEHQLTGWIVHRSSKRKQTVVSTIGSSFKRLKRTKIEHSTKECFSSICEESRGLG